MMLARTMRVSCGTYRNAIVSTSTGSDLPNTATKTAASAMPGNDMMTSMMRMRISAIHLGAVAAIVPSTQATARATSVAPRPITSE